MARYINIKQADLNNIKKQALEDFKTMLDKYDTTPEKLLDTISFREKYTLGPTNIEKQYVYITASAYLKMLMYVLGTDKEIAWHGTVLTDLEKHPNKFVITDTFLYPQAVTGATVTTDQTKYNEWTQALDDDTFNNLRFQGHSHVNMATNPSSVDTTFYEDLVQNLHNGEFYIFMILNKRQDMYFRIYNTKTNIMYDKEDIEIIILDDNNENLIADTKTDIKEFITERTYSYLGGGLNQLQHPGLKTPSNKKDHYLDGKMLTLEEYEQKLLEEEQESMFNYYANRDIYNNTTSKSKKRNKER